MLALHKEYKIKSDDYKYCARRAKEIFFKELNRKLHNPEITPGKKFKLLNRLMNIGKNSYIPPIIEDGEVTPVYKRSGPMHFAEVGEGNESAV